MSKLVSILIIVVAVQLLSAQTLPVGTPVLGEYARRQQLMGDTTRQASMMLLPLFATPDADKRWEVKPMPVIWSQVYASDHPFSLNDGAMIPARGYQTMLSGGVFARYGILSVQLMPELVYAANRDFDGFPDALNKKMWQVYNSVKNRIDLPDRFGNEPYKKMFWGQSSVRLSDRKSTRLNSSH